MSSGLGTNNPIVVAAFHAALRHQALLILVLLAVLAVLWNAWRWRGGGRQAVPGGSAAEPAGRTVLRIGFGGLWLLDGLLQLQQSMPLGLIPNVVQPAASSSPGWVQHLVNDGATVWSNHPVTAAVAAVWVQLGLGLWLLVAGRGTWSRLAGVAAGAWAVGVWIFGEAFGGIFAPGVSWLTGGPGAVVFYGVAGALVALPPEWWVGERMGRWVLRGTGALLLGMAVLQAWPGRGFWQGQPHASSAPGTLTAMLQQMSQTPQPAALQSMVSWFAGFDAAHGWAVNLVAVVSMAAVGTGLATARRPWCDAAAAGALVLCLYDWVLVQDMGVFGGLGTDPNSMLPFALLVGAGWFAVSRPPVLASPTVVARPGPDLGRLAALLRATPAHALRVTAAVGALAVVLVGAVPMVAAAAQPHGDPLLTEAIDGSPQSLDAPAADFSLVDAAGRRVTLASLRGRTVALTFLDPVCTSDCPIVAQEFRQADQLLGASARRVELLAIDANPGVLAPAYLARFDAQEHLTGLPNWDYLTGTLPQLQGVWRAYGEEISVLPGGGMAQHSDLAVVIGPDGHLRELLNADPGPGTSSTMSSFAVTLADAIRTVANR